ncbi:MAG: hypothetical protein ACJATA_001716 [Sphingobacteriales bacterium]|jgi:hypothetical protein
MKLIFTICFFSLLSLTCFGQFELKGFNGLGWGMQREDLNINLVFEMSFADDGFVNCEGPSLKIFDNVPADFLTYRFYKGRLFEVSLGFNPVHLTPVINEITFNFGYPEKNRLSLETIQPKHPSHFTSGPKGSHGFYYLTKGTTLQFGVFRQVDAYGNQPILEKTTT